MYYTFTSGDVALLYAVYQAIVAVAGAERPLIFIHLKGVFGDISTKKNMHNFAASYNIDRTKSFTHVEIITPKQTKNNLFNAFSCYLFLFTKYVQYNFNE